VGSFKGRGCGKKTIGGREGKEEKETDARGQFGIWKLGSEESVIYRTGQVSQIYHGIW
jgi:hypothetical protein